MTTSFRLGSQSSKEKKKTLFVSRVEVDARQKRRRENVSKILLSGIGALGLLAVAATAPNSVQLLRFFPGMNVRKGYTARNSFNRLVERGLIAFMEKNGKKFAMLTEEGRRRLRLYNAYGATVGKIWKRWDGGWRFVVYDIPEKRRSTRLLLLSILKRHGFYKLQSSVWVYPYDCEELISLIKADIGEGRSIVYGVVTALENDKKIREHFGLPLM